MSNRAQGADDARNAYEAMADVIAGVDITMDQQHSIDNVKAFREEYKNAVEKRKSEYLSDSSNRLTNML